jgi:uncharacterized protein YhaN
MPSVARNVVAAPQVKSGEAVETLSREEQRDRDKQKKKLESQLQKHEREIERLELEIAAMNEEIALLDYSDSDASKKKLDAYAALKSQLDEVMKQWEETGNELSGF